MRDNENSLMSRLSEAKIQDSLDNFRMMYEIMGRSEQEIDRLLRAEEKKQLEYYAYTIMHDQRLNAEEKKKRVLNLPSDHTEELYKRQKRLQKKENLYQWKKKIFGK